MPEDTTTKDGTYINCPSCNHTIDVENSSTVSTDVRWKWVGTILASASILSLVSIIILTGLGIITLSPIGQVWSILYATVVLMASTWTFGKETLETVKEMRGK